MEKKNTLKTRNLGGMEVSALGFGCMNFVWAYGHVMSKEEAIPVIRHAYEQGVTLFDTAEIYGTFTSEEFVGEALAPVRDEVKISTKVGFNVDFTTGAINGLNAEREHLRKALEGSLRRLRTDHVDMLYLHRLDKKVPVEEVAETMGQFIKEGKVLHWGLSEVGPKTIRRAHAVTPLSAIQNEMSLWTRLSEPYVLNVCEELGLGFVPWSPLGMGFFAGAVDENSVFTGNDLRAILPRFRKESITANRGLLDILKGVAARYEATPAQVQLAWELAKRPFIVPIPGTTRIDHLDENLGALNINLSREDVEYLDRESAAFKVAGALTTEELGESLDDMTE